MSLIPEMIEKLRFECLASHCDQTDLVERMIELEAIPPHEIENVKLLNSYLPDRRILKWIQFHNLLPFDYEKLDQATMPQISSRYGTWLWMSDECSNLEDFLELVISITHPDYYADNYE